MLGQKEQLLFRAEPTPTFLLPTVDGFTEHSEFDVTDADVAKTLRDVFGPQRLIEARVSGITKQSDFLLFIPRNASVRFKTVISDFAGLGLLQQRTGNVLSARNSHDYSIVERHLEGKSGTDALNHTYNMRATAGKLGEPSTIDLHNFSNVDLDLYAYLYDLRFSPREKMMLYLLGTVVHEVTHRLEEHTGVGPAIRAEICGNDYEQWHSQRSFCSRYVERHALDFGSSPEVVLREELAELVRIFVTNPLWMLNHNQDGYRLIEKHFAFLEPGVLQDIVAAAKI